MKAKSEIINGQLLGRYLNEIKAGGLERIGIFECNRGNSFSKTISVEILLLLMSAVVSVTVLLRGNPWLLAFAVITILGLVYFLCWKQMFRCEWKYWQMFKDAQSEIEKREYALELVFRGYFKIKAQAKTLHPSDSMKEFHYLLDWVRAEILSLIKQAEDGQKNRDNHQSGFAKGKLDIRFTVAKHLFGYDLDQGQGYKMFFSGQIKRVMTNFV